MTPSDELFKALPPNLAASPTYEELKAERDALRDRLDDASNRVEILEDANQSLTLSMENGIQLSAKVMGMFQSLDSKIHHLVSLFPPMSLNAFRQKAVTAHLDENGNPIASLQT